MSLHSEYVELDELGGRRFRQTIHLKPIAYREGGVLKRSVHDWADGDAAFPHVITKAGMLVYATPSGDRRICLTRDPLRYVEIGAPYLKPAATWNKVSLGTPTRSGNMLAWTTAQAKVNVVMGGHFVDLSCEFLNGWQPPNGQIAFPVGMSGLTRVGSVFYADGKPVLTLRPFSMYDAANPTDVRSVDTKLVQVAGQWYALATLPSLAGMSRPTLDPTLTLQPNAADGKDTWIDWNYPTLNCGTTVNLYETSNGRRPLIQFDCSSVPATAICSSATLYLYHFTPGTATPQLTLSFYSVAVGNAAWIEGTRNYAQALAGEPCWNALAADGVGGVLTPWAGSAGLSTVTTDYEASVLGSFHPVRTDPLGTEYSTPLTAARIQGWFGPANTNYGLLAICTGANDSGMCSSDYPTAALRPKLVVNYTLPGGLLLQLQNHGVLSGGMI